MKSILQKPYIFLIVIILGVSLTVLMVKNKKPAVHSDLQMEKRSVDVIQVAELPFSAQAKAFGNVEPAISLQSKAELSGKITYLHPDLQQGNSIPADTVVIKIDTVDFEVSLSQSEADLATQRASLKQLQEEEKTTRRSLNLAKQNLKVGEKELSRIQDLFKRGVIARATVDTEKQNVIQLRQSVSDLQGTLNTYASRLSSEQAQIDRAEQQVKGQQTTLGRTEIRVPFNARIGAVSVEQGEFVTTGAQLFEAQATSAVEINAQLPLAQMSSLVRPRDTDNKPIEVERLKHVLKELQLEAVVSLVVGNMKEAEWDAKILRFSDSVDPTRRTVGIVVGIDDPYKKIIPGKRPPLLKGMFTQVIIKAAAVPRIVIPYSALHQGRVYLVNEQGKLQIQPVEVENIQGELAIISSGLSGGEQLITTDLIPVIPGMPLQPVLDKEQAETLRKQALGAAL